MLLHTGHDPSLSAAGLPLQWNRPPTSLAGQTIPEAEQLADDPIDNHVLGSLLNSFQSLGLMPNQHPQNPQAEPHPQAGAGQAHMASPFASPEHAPPLDFAEGGTSKTVGSGRLRSGSVQPGQRSGTLSVASSASSGANGLPSNVTSGVNAHSPFASPNQQMHKMSSASSMGSGPGKSPSGRPSQNTSRQTSSPTPPSPDSAAV